MAEPLDHGSANFGPSNLEFTSIDIGNTTVNLFQARRVRASTFASTTATAVSLRMLIETRARGRRRAGALAYRLRLRMRICS
jgi:succinyl-diaminopimelate desuccinylase